jgi:hypothetical protein
MPLRGRGLRLWLTGLLAAALLLTSPGCLCYGLLKEIMEATPLPTRGATPAPAPTPSPNPSPSPTPLPSPTPAPTPKPTPPPTVTLKPVTLASDTSPTATPGGTVFIRNYAWKYKGITYLWRIEVPESLYTYFKAKARPPTRVWSVYVTHPRDDEYIDGLAAVLTEAAKARNLSNAETAQFAANFIQSLPYTSDKVTTGFDEYPRYPLETLVDNGGDCEDTSILAAAVLGSMGYQTQLVRLPGHMAVAVQLESTYPGTFIDDLRGDVHYYYLETTGENFIVGKVPAEYQGIKPELDWVFALPVFDTHFNYSARGASGTITVTTTNISAFLLDKGYVQVAFDSGNGDTVWNMVKSETFSLAPDATKTVTLSLNVPQGKHTRLLVGVTHSRFWVLDTVYSRWFDT